MRIINSFLDELLSNLFHFSTSHFLKTMQINGLRFTHQSIFFFNGKIFLTSALIFAIRLTPMLPVKKLSRRSGFLVSLKFATLLLTLFLYFISVFLNSLKISSSRRSAKYSGSLLPSGSSGKKKQYNFSVSVPNRKNVQIEILRNFTSFTLNGVIQQLSTF